MDHPTHRGLAIRAVDVAAGRVPGINPHKLNGLHPDSEKPIGYDHAIDEATRLNYMDTPAFDRLIGASPAYVMIVRVITPGAPLPDEFRDKGYRVGESYYMPETVVQAAHRGEDVEWPQVWNASEAYPEPAPERAPSEYHADPDVESEQLFNLSQAKKAERARAIEQLVEAAVKVDQLVRGDPRVMSSLHMAIGEAMVTQQLAAQGITRPRGL